MSIGAKNITPLISVFVNPFVKLYFVSIGIIIARNSYLESRGLSTKRVCDNMRVYTLYPSVTGFEDCHKAIIMVPTFAWSDG